MIIDETRLAELRGFWSMFPGFEPNGFMDCLNTIEVLLKVGRAGANIEDLLEVPALLGDSGRDTVQKAIDQFRQALKEAGLSGNSCSTMTASNDKTSGQK